MLGLRRGAIHLAIQITVWTAGVAGALLLFQPVLRWFVARSLGGLGLLLLVGAAIVAGLVLSRAIWTRLQERVGFSGAIVGLVAVVATVVIAGGSGAIAGAFGVSSVLSGPIGLAIVGTVLVRVIHDVALDG